MTIVISNTQQRTFNECNDGLCETAEMGFIVGPIAVDGQKQECLALLVPCVDIGAT